MGEPSRLQLLEASIQAAGELWTIVDRGVVVARFGEDLFGHGLTNLPLSDVGSYVHPDDVHLFHELIASMTSHEGVTTQHLRARIRDRDEQWRWTELTVMDRRSDPEIGGLISRIRFAEAVGSTSSASTDSAYDEQFVSLAEVVPAAILTADLEGRVKYSNVELRRLLNRPVRDLADDGWRDVVHPDDLLDVARASEAAFRGIRGEILFRIIDREDLRWLLGRFAPMRIGGEIAGLVAVFDDVTAQREVESQLAHQATHDALTGIPNRVLLRDRLSQALGRRARTGVDVVAFFIDLDRFKSVNDRHGHSVGDEVLVEVARRLLTIVRPTDTVARLGGDEFIVIGDSLDEQSATALAARIIESLADPILTSVGEIRMAGSIGVEIVKGPATVDEVIHQADAAMYRAKRNGGATFDLHVQT